MTATCTMTRSVMLNMANSAGNLFGGTLMGWMDEVTGITAHRFTWTRVTTAAVKSINFYVPIHYGTVLQLEGRVIRVGRSSLDVEVVAYLEPETEDAAPIKAADGVFTYVSINEACRPIPIRKKLEDA